MPTDNPSDEERTARVTIDSTSTSHAAPSQSIRPYYCDYEECKLRDRAWDTISELKKHQRVHMPKEQRPHACAECGRRFHYTKDVKRHMQANHNEKMPVTCPFCNRELSRDDNLQRHITTLHDNLQTPGSTEQTPSTLAPSSVTLAGDVDDAHRGKRSVLVLSWPLEISVWYCYTAWK